MLKLLHILEEKTEKKIKNLLLRIKYKMAAQFKMAAKTKFA
jgi:hypothetical protein